MKLNHLHLIFFFLLFIEQIVCSLRKRTLLVKTDIERGARESKIIQKLFAIKIKFKEYSKKKMTNDSLVQIVHRKSKIQLNFSIDVMPISSIIIAFQLNLLFVLKMGMQFDFMPKNISTSI